jgi:molybdenum cofactor biosynthesis enzyme MoaA
MLLTSRCNFKCPYCRSVGGTDKPFDEAAAVVRLWASQGLYAIRFSGGEPLIYPRLRELVELAKAEGIERIAVSSNGSFPLHKYVELLASGVNDLSISLDACCAEDGDHMAGGVKGAFNRVVSNIRELAQLTYITVGVVLTEDNVDRINDIIRFADELGVQDIRVIPAAQDGNRLSTIQVDADILERHPILKYRVQNFQAGRPVRGLRECDSTKCGLVLDDMAVCEGYHYPCIIYLREGGRAIGKITDATIRADREAWFQAHNTHTDPICSKNCLDVCVDYNNRFEEARKG